MTLAGHYTKLNAVNDMLRSIGEDPVNSLSSGLADAELAEEVLDAVSHEVQSIGWHVNTRRAITLTTDASDNFVLPDNTIKVDTVSSHGPRQNSSPRPSAWVNASMRRNQADTTWILYDIDNDSETWTDPTTLTVDIVQRLEFANLTPALQRYITALAGHRFQQGIMGSRALFEFTQQQVDEALQAAVNEDTENEDINMIRDNKHVHSIVWRNNPLYGS
jgi:hypothetical protein